MTAPLEVSNLPDAEYHQLEGISNSLLGRMLPTAAHCKEYQDNPPEQTTAMLVGSVLHTLVLEPALFKNRYVLHPDQKRPTISQINAANPAAKTLELIEFWKEFDAENEGKKVVKKADMDAATRMAASVVKHPAANKLLQTGSKELSLMWDDKQHGVAMKCRIDNLRDHYVIDLKKSVDASPEGFARAMSKYGYHRQAAIYSDGVEAVFGSRPAAFIFVVVEPEPPYAVAVYQLDQQSFSIGYEQYRELLARFIQCRESDTWPAYGDAVAEITLPPWYKNMNAPKLEQIA